MLHRPAHGKAEAESLGQPVDQQNPYVERELLTGDGIDQRFKETWKAGRLDPGELVHEFPERRRFGRKPVKRP